MKKTVLGVLSLFMMTLLLANALAITGLIGNAKMILQVQTGEEIEKSILVRNVNNVSVDINISVSGELADSINIKDKQFKLNAGEEKKAYFTVKANKPGTTESQINVAFTPEDGSGVGLSSTVIVVASGEEVEDTGGILGWLTGNKNSTSTGNNESSGATGAFAANPVSIGLLSTTIILALFIILLVVYSKKVKNKRETKSKRNVKTSE
jgi:hypothetical protein